MSRNILELKSVKIAPEKVQTLSAAKRLAKLKDFELKEEYFEPIHLIKCGDLYFINGGGNHRYAKPNS